MGTDAEAHSQILDWIQGILRKMGVIGARRGVKNTRKTRVNNQGSSGAQGD